MSFACLWRRMPPALFPSMLGLVGAALGWRRFAREFDMGHGGSSAFSIAVAVAFLGLVAIYALKVLARPGVVSQEVRGLPGRLGLGAMSVAWMLLASHMQAWSGAVALAMLYVGIAFHVILMGFVVRALSQAAALERKATPAWHLTFVGFIAIPFAAFAVGLFNLGLAVYLSTIIIAVIIYSITLNRLVEQGVPRAQRPMQAIHLAPISLFAILSSDLGLTGLSFVLTILAVIVALMLVVNVRWLTADGFSPLWGAFTFPTIAFANALLALGSTLDAAATAGAIVLIFGTLLTLWVAGRIWWMWFDGRLSKGTQAAKV